MIVLALLPLAAAMCSFTQDASNETPHAWLEPVEPQLYNYTGDIACPIFNGSPTCCNTYQNYDMATRFVMIDLTMGNPSGGCDICAANMKKLWCYFTCSPDQSTFVSAGVQENVTDPTDPNGQEIDLVMLSNFTVTYATACSIYESCSKCPYVVEVSAMHSAAGFLNFQGYNSIEYGATWTTFIIEDSSIALDLDFATCNTNTTELYGYTVKPCTCNNCEDSCTHSYSSSSSSLSEGLNWEWVWIAYLILTVFSIVILFGKYMWERKKLREARTAPEEEDRELVSAEY